MERGLIVLVLLAVVSLGQAQVNRNFTVRYNIETRGAIAVAGNTVLTCSTTTGTNAAQCAGARAGTATSTAAANDNQTMVNINTLDTTQTNVTQATLDIPAGSTVLWAGLYWGGRSTLATRNQVNFRPANATAYTAVTSSQLDSITSTVTGADFYHAFADVTAAVRSAGSGDYRVANVKTQTGQIADGGAYGGWALYVVYQNASLSPRDITVFDGFARVNTANNNVAATVSGFRAPPSGTFTSRVRTFTYEGDRLATGDNLQVNGTTITDALNPSGNFYNSSITNLGNRVTTKNPDYVDQLALDIDSIDLPAGTIANSARSANLNFTTSGDQYFPGVLTFTTDVFEPVLSSNFTKVTTNASGSGAPGQGDVLNFTISVQNSGNDNGNSVVVTDIVPSGTTYVPGSLQVVSGPNVGIKTDAAGDDQATYNATTGQVTFNLGTGATASAGGTLAPNASTVIRLQARINSTVSSGASISNQATLNFTGSGGTAYSAQSDGDPNTAGSQATTITVLGRDYGDAPDASTGTGTGNYQTTNTDGGARHSVVAGLSLGAVAADLDNGTLQNATATADDTNGTDDEDGIIGFPAIPTASGQSVTVPVSVTNTTGSSTTLVGYIDFNKDGSFGGTNERATVDVNNGATSANLTFTTPAGLTVGTTYARFRISSIATEVTSSVGAASSGEVEDYQVTIGSPDLTIAKTHTGNFTRGSTGTYTVTVGNGGTQPTSGAVTVTDTLPTGLTYVAGSVGGTNGGNWTCSASGETVTCTSTTAIPTSGSSVFTFGVNVAATTADSVTNTATVAGGSEATANNTNNTANDPTTTVGTPDLTVDKSHTDTFTRGSSGTYTFVVSNSGSVATSGTLTLTDTLPANFTVNGGAAGSVTAGGTNGANWTCSSNAASPQVITCTSTTAIAAGGSSTLSLNVNVGAAAAANVNNTVSVAGGGELAANTGNNSDIDPTTTVSAADLTLAKTHTGSFTVGSTGTYSFTVANGGETASSGAITVTDTLPTGLSYAGSVGGTNGVNWSCSASGQTVTCTSSAVIAAGSSSTFTFNVTVGTSTAPGTNSVTNTASVSGGGDSNTTNNAASDPTTILSSNLTISKTHTPTSFIRGSTGTYTLTVGNTGTAATSGTITVTDTLPAGLSVSAGSVTLSGTNAAAWSCSASGQTIACTSTTAIAISGSSTFSFSVNVLASAPASVTNTATVSGGNEAAANAGNNTANDPTTTVGSADLTLSKTASSTFVRGSTGTYTLTVTNSGDAASSGTITVTDVLPTGLSYSGFSGAGWSCSASGQTVTCSSSSVLAVAGTSSVELTVSIATTAPTSIDNTATVSGGGELNTGNNSSTVTTSVGATIDLNLSKAVDRTSPQPDETVVFTLTVGNDGPSPATNVIVEDVLPAGFTFVSTDGCLQDPNGTPSCTLGTLTSGSQASFTLTATVQGELGTTLTNTATTRATEIESNTANNSASASVTLSGVQLVKAVCNLTVSGCDSEGDYVTEVEGAPGDILEYRISYTRVGPAVFDIVLEDEVPTFNQIVENAYPNGGEVAVLCPDGDTVYLEQGPTPVVSFDLADACALQTGTRSGGAADEALLSGNAGNFRFRALIP